MTDHSSRMGARTSRIGVRAAWRTLSATLPIIQRCHPPYPWVAITIRSTFRYSASAAIAEAATTLQRKLNKPALVAQILTGVKARQFLVEPITEDILDARFRKARPALVRRTSSSSMYGISSRNSISWIRCR
jgi:hypothetical protein